MKYLRVLIRIPLVFLHTLVAIPLCAFLLGPRARRIQVRGRPLHDRAVNWWARVFCRILGVKVALRGEVPQGGQLLVANHVSFLDIVVIHTCVAASFIAKGEIRRWPLVGWFSHRADSIFHQRGSAASLRRVADAMRDRLRAGQPVALFPEAGTGQLHEVRPFHGRLFQPALDAPAPVLPVAIDYRQDGQRLGQVAFEDNETFLGAVMRLLGEHHIHCELHFLASIPVGDAASAADDEAQADSPGGRTVVANASQGRKALAARAREAIVTALHADHRSESGDD